MATKGKTWGSVGKAMRKLFEVEQEEGWSWMVPGGADRVVSFDQRNLELVEEMEKGNRKDSFKALL